MHPVVGSLGILGEYIDRIFTQVKQRPVYLVKESNIAQKANPARGLPGQELKRAA